MKRTTTTVEKRGGLTGFICGGVCVILFVAGIGDLKGCSTVAGLGKDIQGMARGVGDAFANEEKQR